MPTLSQVFPSFCRTFRTLRCFFFFFFKLKYRKAHYVHVGVCHFRISVLEVSSWEPLFGEEWTFLAALQLEMPGGRRHGSRVIRPGVSPNGCDLWGSTTTTACSPGPLCPNRQVMRREPEVSAELERLLLPVMQAPGEQGLTASPP